jgi:NAD(P)-dependent dehydrogenase (short-subunit alcohol dehydrogenase family)
MPSVAIVAMRKASPRRKLERVRRGVAFGGRKVRRIAPGFFVTNIGGGHARNPDVQAALAKDIPMHRVGLPGDIKALALFLASPASDYVTSQEIVIDGG